MNAILTQNLCKTYGGVHAVNDLNLTVKEGELFALLGVNGAGKTTTIKMLSCLTRPTSGDAQILGHSVTNDAINVKKWINVSPQETAVAPNLSVKENLLLICGLYGDDKKTAREKTKTPRGTEKCDFPSHAALQRLYPSDSRTGSHAS